MVQKLVTEFLYWVPMVWSESWEGAEMDTESAGHHPWAVLQAFQTPVHEVWGGNGCSSKQASWQWLLGFLIMQQTAGMGMSEGSWFSDIASGPAPSSGSWTYLNHHLATLYHSQENPEDTLPVPCPMPAPAWTGVPFGALLCCLLLSQYVLPRCCLALISDCIQALSPLLQALIPNPSLASHWPFSFSSHNAFNQFPWAILAMTQDMKRIWNPT